MFAWFYFMDEFKSVDVNIDRIPESSEEGLKALVSLRNTVKDIIEEKYDIKPLQIKPYRFYKGENGVLFEYTIQLENGFLSAKLMISENPWELLYEYYDWEKPLKI